MENRDGEIHLDSDEARAGSNSNVVRWVLGIGLLLAVIGMSLAWIIPSLNHGPETMNAQNVQGNMERNSATQGTSTDSIVGENADKIRDTADASGTSDADRAQPTVENSGKAQ
jgi:hypothetical protein